MSDDVKKYTSIYEIKDYALNVLGPKYFPEDVIEGYNVGFLGYALDIMSTTTEDMFNTVPIVINEMYPNIAQMPSSIYNYASLFQYSNLLSVPATMDCVILLPAASIKSNRPPGMATPMAPHFSKDFSAGRYAIRAVASACPYMTTNFLFSRSAYSANFLCSSGKIFPPACVIVRKSGSLRLKNINLSNIS